jgi:AraC-like DNA-binding protein
VLASGLGAQLTGWTHFSTDTLDRSLSMRGRLDAWVEMHSDCKAIARCDMQIEADKPFHSTITSAKLDRISVTKSVGSGASLTRSSRLVRTDPSDLCVMVMPQAGRSFSGETKGRSFSASAGEPILLSYDRANATFTQDFGSVTSIALPRDLLLSTGHAPEDMVGTAFAAKTPAFKLLSVIVDSIFDARDKLDSTALDLAGQHITDLVVDTLKQSVLAEKTVSIGNASAQLNALLKLIDNHAHDTNFCLDVAARGLGMSRRAIQALFAEIGTGFQDALVLARLRRSYKLLTNAEGDHFSITSIAFRTGFSDISTFNRQFRRVYGLTPTEARALRQGN